MDSQSQELFKSEPILKSLIPTGLGGSFYLFLTDLQSRNGH